MQQKRMAFFDVDETLINVKSMFSFRAFYFRWLWGEKRGTFADQEAARRLQLQVREGMDRSVINTLFYEAFRGHWPQLVREAAHEWYLSERSRPDFFIASALAALRKHQRDGVGVAFVSGSAVDFLTPLAKELDVRYLLANRMEVEDGQFTGALIPPQTIGDGKQIAVSSLLSELGIDPSGCYGYGDHLSDLPLLKCIGHPHVVARDPALVEVARLLGWCVLNPMAHAA
ncbi:HAD family hydrolase [Variovorax sp. M-6]|uniref:HAD family hydrolase n=1 Tax=Variovorax sp. M-6 TaxID=3233041 RepID=UPI003F959A52